MKTKVLLLGGLLLCAVSLTSCSTDSSEELREIEQLEIVTDQNVQSIDKGEITEDDT